MTLARDVDGTEGISGGDGGMMRVRAAGGGKKRGETNPAEEESERRSTLRLRLCTWNINGIRTVLKKYTPATLSSMCKGLNDPHILCLQETKINIENFDENNSEIDGYDVFWSTSQVKKGYSGVCVLARKGLTRSVRGGFGEPQFDQEGRILIVDVGFFVLFNLYVPNGRQDTRTDYKMAFLGRLRQEVDALLAAHRNVVLVGDFNICHQEIDIAQVERMRGQSGFLDEERRWVTALTQEGCMVDAFRTLHPTEPGFTWFDPHTHMGGRPVDTARPPRYHRLRLDYAFLSGPLMAQLGQCDPLPQVMGSDHCPLAFTLTDPQPPGALEGGAVAPEQAAPGDRSTSTATAPANASVTPTPTCATPTPTCATAPEKKEKVADPPPSPWHVQPPAQVPPKQPHKIVITLNCVATPLGGPEATSLHRTGAPLARPVTGLVDPGTRPAPGRADVPSPGAATLDRYFHITTPTDAAHAPSAPRPVREPHQVGAAGQARLQLGRKHPLPSPGSLHRPKAPRMATSPQGASGSILPPSPGSPLPQGQDSTAELRKEESRPGAG
ncbi:putative exodeoxyribonuclease III [Paratrimastix pyriformis]|uniref:DNA-(apurinic or apyrimidinic site) endonuclease n=1 Tax=Paratrimastix pyriformis TaxID=342808 RepID=A0ABQ8UA22_9EUKA|nr:putative exodeoxyribonuclease III [Paratrimastix pyriformis]